MRTKEAKRISATEAIANIHSGQRIVLPLCCGLPQTLVEALIADHKRLKGTELVSGLQIIYPFLEEGLEQSFTFRTWQCAPPIRHLLKKGTVQYIPMRQGDVLKVFSKNGPWPIDIALIQVSLPDEKGYLSLGVSIGHSFPLALEAPLVIAEVNAQMPRVLGKCFIHLSQIDFLVESDRPLLEYVSRGKPGENENKIGRYVADLIPDSATLQIGIGAIPEAVLDALADKQDLRFFSMGIDRIKDLADKGVVKSGTTPKVIVTEILGTKKIFEFVHNNPMVQGVPIQEAINPRVAGQIPKFCSIISAIEIDLTGQVNAETIKGEQFSAIGGSYDFVLAALFSEQGKSIIAMTSTTPDEKISRIVAQLPPGSAVTTPRHSVQYVVTEYGVADLWGKSLKERADALIDVAHPKFRDELMQKAKELF